MRKLVTAVIMYHMYLRSSSMRRPLLRAAHEDRGYQPKAQTRDSHRVIDTDFLLVFPLVAWVSLVEELVELFDLLPDMEVELLDPPPLMVVELLEEVALELLL